MKPIVVYFSNSGTTEQISQEIAKDLNCETYKIEPVGSYGSHVEALARLTFEKITRKKSHYANILPDFSEYDMIILGYPVWGSRPPEFVVEFMKNINTDGKLIIPFSSSATTSITATLKDIRGINQNAKVLYPFNYSKISKDDYEDWIKILKALLV